MEDAPVVVALGGNALAPDAGRGTIAQQFEQTRRTAVILAAAIAAGQRMIITHGNGPQVGNAIRRVELAAHKVTTLPLDICVADLQGGLGYMISQCITNALGVYGSDQVVSTLLSSVEVSPDDPDFTHPSKPVGPWYDEASARIKQEDGWNMAKMQGRGYRRLVPSPRPIRIIEIDLIRHLVEQGRTIITMGGGGIPVVRQEGSTLVGVEAVIDKDLSTGLLASVLGLETMFIITNVARVCLDWGSDEERSLQAMTLGEAKKHLADGHFPPGSMGPKIQAAINFLEQTPAANPRVVITDIASMDAALRGKGGTVITRN